MVSAEKYIERMRALSAMASPCLRWPCPTPPFQRRRSRSRTGRPARRRRSPPRPRRSSTRRPHACPIDAPGGPYASSAAWRVASHPERAVSSAQQPQLLFELVSAEAVHPAADIFGQRRPDARAAPSRRLEAQEVELRPGIRRVGRSVAVGPGVLADERARAVEDAQRGGPEPKKHLASGKRRVGRVEWGAVGPHLALLVRPGGDVAHHLEGLAGSPERRGGPRRTAGPPARL